MGEQKKSMSPFEQKMNDWIADHLTRVKVTDKIFFLDHLKTMLHAGLSLIESLSILSKETENKKLKKIIGAITADVEKGNQLSDVLAHFPKIFPPMYVKMIAAGEIAGKLEESLEQIATQMKKSHALTSTIRGALIYPCVILVALSGVAILMVTVILPKLMTIFSEFDAQLPLATRILIAITNFMSKPLNLILVFGSLIAAISLFITGLKRSTPFKKTIHALNLRLPIAGRIIKQINLARFSLSLSSLLKSTLPIVEAVDITADTCSNIHYSNALRAASEKIKKGIPLSEILLESSRLFPPMVTEMIMVGEKTGEIDHLLSELAAFYTDEVDKTMKNFSTIIEPAIIILLGLGVGGIAVAVIMPMLSLAQNF